MILVLADEGFLLDSCIGVFTLSVSMVRGSVSPLTLFLSLRPLDLQYMDLPGWIAEQSHQTMLV